MSVMVGKRYVIPKKHQKLFERAYAGARGAAVKARCIDCRGLGADSLKPCQIPMCPLFALGKSKKAAIRAYCRWCMNGPKEVVDRIRTCENEECPLWRVRPYQKAVDGQEVPQIEGVADSEGKERAR